MIEVKNLKKYFKRPIRKEGIWGMVKTLFTRKYDLVKAVDDISFSIKEGEIVGYIGANGAGKSTTIKMMCGILTPTEGTITINGYNPNKGKNRNKYLKQIGVVFGQRSQLWWDLPVVESFKLVKEIYEVSDEDYEERFKYLCEIMELDKFMASPVRTLSLGQRMRADLAAAIIYNPSILYLDEPTIGLDVLVKEKIIHAIKEIHQKYNTTIILTTHDMGDIQNLCQRIIIIDEGKVLYDGLLHDIKTRFGDIRKVKVEVKGEVNCEQIMNDFNNLLTAEMNEHTLVITMDALKIHIDDVLNYIIQNYSISDLTIDETSIEEVVKKIYEDKAV